MADETVELDLTGLDRIVRQLTQATAALETSAEAVAAFGPAGQEAAQGLSAATTAAEESARATSLINQAVDAAVARQRALAQQLVATGAASDRVAASLAGDLSRAARQVRTDLVNLGVGEDLLDSLEATVEAAATKQIQEAERAARAAERAQAQALARQQRAAEQAAQRAVRLEQDAAARTQRIAEQAAARRVALAERTAAAEAQAQARSASREQERAQREAERRLQAQAREAEKAAQATLRQAEAEARLRRTLADVASEAEEVSRAQGGLAGILERAQQAQARYVQSLVRGGSSTQQAEAFARRFGVAARAAAEELRELGASEREAAQLARALTQAGQEAERSVTGINNAGSALNGLGDDASRAIRQLVSVAAVGAAARGAFELVSTGAENLLEVDRAATRLAVSRETVAAFGAAARRVGEDLDFVAEPLENLPDRLQQIAGGTGEAAEALAVFGDDFDAATLAAKDNDTALRELTARIGGLESESDKARVAAAFFGDAGLRLLEAGAFDTETAIADLVDQIRESGEVSTEAVASARSFRGALAELSETARSISADIFEAFGEPAIALVENFTAGVQILRFQGFEPLRNEIAFSLKTYQELARVLSGDQSLEQARQRLTLFRQATDEANQAAEDELQAFALARVERQEANREVQEYTATTVQATAATSAQAQATEDAADAARQQAQDLREVERITRALLQTRQQAESDREDASSAIVASLERELVLIREQAAELERLGQSTDAATQAAEAVTGRAERDLQALTEEYRSATTDLQQAVAEIGATATDDLTTPLQQIGQAANEQRAQLAEVQAQLIANRDRLLEQVAAQERLGASTAESRQELERVVQALDATGEIAIAIDDRELREIDELLADRPFEVKLAETIVEAFDLGGTEAGAKLQQALERGIQGAGEIFQGLAGGNVSFSSFGVYGQILDQLLAITQVNEDGQIALATTLEDLDEQFRNLEANLGTLFTDVGPDFLAEQVREGPERQAEFVRSVAQGIREGIQDAALELPAEALSGFIEGIGALLENAVQFFAESLAEGGLALDLVSGIVAGFTSALTQTLPEVFGGDYFVDLAEAVEEGVKRAINPLLDLFGADLTTAEGQEQAGNAALDLLFPGARDVIESISGEGDGATAAGADRAAGARARGATVTTTDQTRLVELGAVADGAVINVYQASSLSDAANQTQRIAAEGTALTGVN